MRVPDFPTKLAWTPIERRRVFVVLKHLPGLIWKLVT